MVSEINQGDSITLDGYEKLTDVALQSILQCISSPKQIKKLSCIGCIHLTDACIPLIAQYCPNLKIINLDGCKKLTSRALSQLIADCKNLHDISIRNCNLRRLPYQLARKLKSWEINVTINSRKTTESFGKKKSRAFPNLESQVKPLKTPKLNLNGNPMAECHEEVFKSNNAASIIRYLNKKDKALTYHYRLVTGYYLKLNTNNQCD